MSTIVCLKEADTLVLASDSRYMLHDFSAIASDSVQKIFGVAPETFLAVSGWRMVCDHQARRADELAAELGTTDIRVLAEALDRASGACLEQLAEILRGIAGLHPKIGATVSARQPLHGFILAGRSGGRLGYTYWEYYLCSEGQIASQKTEYFGAERNITVTSGDAVRHLRGDPRTWLYDLVEVAEIFLAEQRKRNPHIGGASQLIAIDKTGARWISRPPAEEVAVGNLAHATISAAVTMTAPTLIITNGPITVNIDQTNMVRVSHSGSAVRARHEYDLFRVESTSNPDSYAVLERTVLRLNSSASLYATLDAGALQLVNGAASALLMGNALFLGGSQVLSTRQTGPGNTTDTGDLATRFNNLLTALRNHGLIT